jgi:uroporphyrinogen decarboxylase
MSEYPGFIFNLGHGITPDINPSKVKVMIDAIRQ